MYGLRARFLSRHIFSSRHFKALAPETRSPRKTDVCDFLSVCDIEGRADSACTSICVHGCCGLLATDGRVCGVLQRRYILAYNVYVLLYIYTYRYMRNTYKHVYPAGAAAASTAGIAAVSHSRHVLLVIFVLFNKKTIKSRHIYNRGTTAVGGIRSAGEACPAKQSHYYYFPV